MKYLKKFNKEILFFNKIKKYKIGEICKKYNIKNYNINTDGSIDVDEYVDLSDKELTKLPIKFNKVTDNFFLEL